MSTPDDPFTIPSHAEHLKATQADEVRRAKEKAERDAARDAEILKETRASLQHFAELRARRMANPGARTIRTDDTSFDGFDQVVAERVAALINAQKPEWKARAMDVTIERGNPPHGKQWRVFVAFPEGA